MQTRGSKFIKYQEVKIQELPDQVRVLVLSGATYCPL